MEEKNEMCGTCRYRTGIARGQFVCDNEESEGYGLETVFDDLCGEYEEREDL